MGLREGIRRRFTKANVARESNGGGIYHLYNERGQRIYTGVTSGNYGAQWGHVLYQAENYL